MNSDIMTARRFREITEAYGADPARWPVNEQAAALAFMTAHADEAEPWLAAARSLDVDLAPGRDVGQVSERLYFQTVARMIAANDVFGDKLPEAETRRSLPLIWAAGAGLVACLIGGLLGVNVGLKSLYDLRAQTVLEQAQMIDMENG